MSVRIMTAVWAMPLPDSEKLVLLALADCANDEGHCWPSVRSLVTKCSKSDRTIQAAIKRLVEAGHLTRREVLGKGCNYTVHPRSKFTPEEAAPPKGVTQTPEAASDKPSRTINSEAKASSQRLVDAWNLMAKGQPRISQARVLDNSRQQSMRLRLKEHGEAILMEAIQKIGRSPWLLGKGRDSNWQVTIDFLLQPKSLRSVLEGAYGETEEKRGLSPAEQAAKLDEQAAFYRRIGRDDDAEDASRRAAAVRSGQGASIIPIGSAAEKFLGRVAQC